MLVRLFTFFYLLMNSSGSAYGNEETRQVSFTGKANLQAGMNKIQLLSVAVGLPVSLLSPFYQH